MVFLGDDGRFDELQSMVDALQHQELLEADRLGIEAKLAECRGDFHGARACLELALTRDPPDSWSLQELCRLLFERFGPDEAVPSLEQLVATEADDAAARYNLAMAYEAQGACDLAVQQYRESLRLRPDCGEAEQRLKQLLARLERQV